MLNWLIGVGLLVGALLAFAGAASLVALFTDERLFQMLAGFVATIPVCVIVTRA